jgi:hypothetical protein
MKTECLQTKRDAALFGKEKDRIELITSLIYANYMFGRGTLRDAL